MNFWLQQFMNISLDKFLTAMPNMLSLNSINHNVKTMKTADNKFQWFLRWKLFFSIVTYLHFHVLDLRIDIIRFSVFGVEDLFMSSVLDVPASSSLSSPVVTLFVTGNDWMPLFRALMYDLFTESIAVHQSNACLSRSNK